MTDTKSGGIAHTAALAGPALRNAEPLTPHARRSRKDARPFAINADAARDLLRRLGTEAGQVSLEAPLGDALASGPPPAASLEVRFNAALGCKTSEVALRLLSELVRLDHVDAPTVPDDRVNQSLMQATALLAELQPANATEACLAAQMVCTHRAGMMFLANATKSDESIEVRDRNVNRAVRLMRLFTEQLDTMARLKGKGAQQRVIVEHVSVNAGGQAIVGAVMPGGEGRR